MDCSFSRVTSMELRVLHVRFLQLWKLCESLASAASNDENFNSCSAVHIFEDLSLLGFLFFLFGSFCCCAWGTCPVPEEPPGTAFWTLWPSTSISFVLTGGKSEDPEFWTVWKGIDLMTYLSTYFKEFHPSPPSVKPQTSGARWKIIYLSELTC